MNFPFFHVDAFSAKPFRGNPAGICLLDQLISSEQMQDIAAENNVAETAFINREGDRFLLRWFSPVTEMPLCGHATLAAAHILWQEKLLPEEQEAVFETLAGELKVSNKTDGWLELDFPSFDAHAVPLPAEMKDAFPPDAKIFFSNDRYLIELQEPDSVLRFKPDFIKLDKHLVVITCRAEEDSPFDFYSRYFACPVGVPEDAVTGSAHCSLAPYWSEKLDKTNLLAFQASSRGGTLRLRVKPGRVFIGGQAVTVMKGRYKI
jgi:predicted PhzF superfamily epimerase YddE/YHI9